MSNTPNQITRAPINLQIYAIGGTAIDIMASFEAGNTDRAVSTMSHTTISFVDTSDSNLRLIDPNLLYRFPNLKGGGKDRRYIAEQTTPHLPDLLDKHKPAAFNHVIFNASGASGAAVGPNLVKLLLSRGQSVFLTIITSPLGAEIELTNAINTITTLRNYAAALKRSIGIYMLANDEATPQGVVDNMVRSFAYYSAGLFSNLNHGVDETDLRKFLEATQRTAYGSTLMNFQFFKTKKDEELQDLAEHEQAIAQVTLHDADMDRISFVDKSLPGVAYRNIGELNPTLTADRDRGFNMHFVLSVGGVAATMAELKARQADLLEQMAQRRSNVKDFEVDTANTDDGGVY